MSVNVRVSYDPSPELIITRWGSLGRRITQKLSETLGLHLNTIGLEAIRRYFPQGGQGPIAQSISIIEESTQHRISFSIQSDDVEYTRIIRILEYGSQAHSITPVNAEALKFQPSIMRLYLGARMPGGRPVGTAQLVGEYILRASVWHPGTPPYRMFQQGMMDLRPEINQIINESINMEVRWK